jgi:hypothetical protein
LCGILDEESTADRGVGVEAYFELVKEREEVFLDVSGDGVVISLKDGGKDGSCGGLNVVNLLNVGCFVIGEAKLVRLLATARKWLPREVIYTRLNFPAAYSSWIAASVSSIGVLGSGACRK